VATPSMLALTSLTPAILANAQLSSGNNDFTVGASNAWVIKSFTVSNVSGASVTVTGSVIPSGGSARVVFAESIAAGGSLVLDPAVLAMLPAAAVLRLNASAGTAIDTVITGVLAA
jgi:hypothetical protein